MFPYGQVIICTVLLPVQIIRVENQVEDLLNKVSKQMLQDDAPSMPPFLEMVEGSVRTNEKAIKHPEMRKMLEDETTRSGNVFDVWIELGQFGQRQNLDCFS